MTKRKRLSPHRRAALLRFGSPSTSASSRKENERVRSFRPRRDREASGWMSTRKRREKDAEKDRVRSRSRRRELLTRSAPPKCQRAGLSKASDDSVTHYESYRVGERVEALWNEGRDADFPGYFSGRIIEQKVAGNDGRATRRRRRTKNHTTTFTIRYDDGSYEDFVRSASMRPARPRDGSYSARCVHVSGPSPAVHGSVASKKVQSRSPVSPKRSDRKTLRLTLELARVRFERYRPRVRSPKKGRPRRDTDGR